MRSLGLFWMKIRTLESVRSLVRDVIFNQEANALSDSEVRSLYNEYNALKLDLFDGFFEDIVPLAESIQDSVGKVISDWFDKRTYSFTQSLGDGGVELDGDDVLFLLLILTIVNTKMDANRALFYNRFYPSIYERTGKYYLRSEIAKIEKATGKKLLVPDAPGFDIHNNPRLNDWYNGKSVPALTSMGEKYYSFMEKIIKDGYKNGTPLNVIVDQLKAAVDPHSPVSKSRFIFERFARTELAFLTELAKVDSWSKLGVGRVQYLTKLDNKVCPICRPLHGLIFMIGDIKWFPPIHPHCRCCLVPIYDPLDVLSPLLVLPFLDGDD